MPPYNLSLETNTGNEERGKAELLQSFRDGKIAALYTLSRERNKKERRERVTYVFAPDRFGPGGPVSCSATEISLVRFGPAGPNRSIAKTYAP